MADSMHQPRNGSGQFVSAADAVKELVLTILAEREKQSGKDSIQIAKEVTAASATAALAMDKAKEAADKVSGVLENRIEKLESGGAPFASRLDDSMRKLQTDVAELVEGAVRQEVVEALRVRQDKDAESARKRTQAALIAAVTSLGIVFVETALRVFT